MQDRYVLAKVGDGKVLRIVNYVCNLTNHGPDLVLNYVFLLKYSCRVLPALPHFKPREALFFPELNVNKRQTFSLQIEKTNCNGHQQSAAFAIKNSVKRITCLSLTRYCPQKWVTPRAISTNGRENVLVRFGIRFLSKSNTKHRFTLAQFKQIML